MNPKYLYLSIDLLSIALPLAFSFYSKAPFYKKWKFLWIALLLPALIFIAWDAVFTEFKVWGFNSKYITGISLIGLPIEEIMFFFCIPYASVFIYFSLTHIVEKDHLFPHQELISSALIILLLIFGMYYMDRWYTAVTFITLAMFLAFLMLKIKPRYMGRFYFAFGFILIPFFIVNGILTGSFIDEPVVWYDDSKNLGIRILTIPFEDIFYGMLLVLMNIATLEWLEERDYYKKR